MKYVSVKKIFLLSCLLAWNPLFSQFEGDEVFEQSIIHEIEITSVNTIGDLFLLFNDEFLSGDYTYSLAQITIDGNYMDSVGIRVKGGLSGFDIKKPFKLDFNEFVSGQKHDGLKKVNLHQGNMDPSYARESLSYELLRDSGVKTVRTSFANVYFNGNYEGVYTIVEQVDNELINNLFASNDGALYKDALSSLVLKYDNDQTFSYEDFKSAVNNIEQDSLHIQLEDYLDVESFLRFMAIQTYVNEADGPLTIGINYYIYFEPESRKYVYIPWDYNVAFYRQVDLSVVEPSANFIFERVKTNPILRARYLETYCSLLKTSLKKEKVLQVLDRYKALLENQVTLDPFITQLGDFPEEIEWMKNYIEKRDLAISSELEMLVGSCNEVQNPIGEMDIVINEIVASNDSLSGIMDQAGSYPDWIELYNNTSDEILLEDCYLSNDFDFLKHWKFPRDTRILPNAYVIIWADRDTGEEGLHADFKLNKSKGSLYLSHENGEMIDSISYSDQETNISLARLPNGVGDFSSSSSTFGAMNNAVSTKDLQSEDVEFILFPNPTSAFSIIEIDAPHPLDGQIQIWTLDGKRIQIFDKLIEPGENKIELDLSKYEDGIFRVVLRDKKTNRQVSKLLVLIK